MLPAPPSYRYSSFVEFRTSEEHGEKTSGTHGPHTGTRITQTNKCPGTLT